VTTARSLRTVLVALLFLAAARPAHASGISILVGDKDGFGLGLLPGQQLPCVNPAVTPCLSPIQDWRSAAEQIAVNGAQLTDTYSALYDGVEFDCPTGCSLNGPTGTVVFALPAKINAATINMFIGDFESFEFNAMFAYINGIPISFFFNDGYRNTSLRSIALTQPMIDVANATGQITLFLDHRVVPGQIGPNAGSFDYVAFDYFEVIADPIPEPSTWLLLGTGLALGAARLRNRHARRP